MFGHLQIAMQHLGLELTDWSGLPFAEAIRIFKSKKLVTKAEFDRLEDRYKARAWTIAGDHSTYTISQTHASLGEAITEGLSSQEWIAQSAEQFDLWGVTSKGDHHLRTVFNTSTLGAYQHGRFQQSRSPEMLERRPFWKYRTIGDEHVRDSHAAMDGKVFPADHSIWGTWYPPNGFNCRCRVDPIRDGEVSEVPVETPDPGFASAPGV